MARSVPAKSDGRIVKGERTRAAILKEARRIIAERGFDGTSVKDITDAAGVPKSLFYHYFAGFDDLLKEILDSGAVLRRVGKRARNDLGAKDAYVAKVFSALSDEAGDLRILLGEALRRKEPMAALFDSLVEISADLDSAMPEELEKGYGPKELAAIRIYARILPVILLALTEDEAARRLKIGKAALRELVFSALRSPLAPKGEAR